MTNVASKLYDSLKKIQDIENLIKDGEFENQYLECKSPNPPQFNRGLKAEFASTISAFANSGGGIILWGVSTTRHKQGEADVLSQIEELGSINDFKRQADLQCQILIEPQIISCQSKVLTRNPKDSRGVLITLIPPSEGDPVRNSLDHEFYIRVGSAVSKMSYETIKRMFAGSSGPDLTALFDNRLVESQPNGAWKVPIILENNSSFAARDVSVSVTIENETSCESIRSDEFTDQSKINPGKKIFMGDLIKPIFRGKNILAGSLIIKMKKEKIAKRKLELKIDIFANGMRAKTYTMTAQLTKSGLTVKKTEAGFLY